MSKTVLDSLQVFRGFAAVAVVTHHAALSTDASVEGVHEAKAWLEDKR